MGAGFALIVPKKDVRTIISISKIFGIEAMVGGHVEKSSEKRVVIKPKGIEFTAKDLEIS
ncbi:MAG TPA: phosphoribosylformylglycinamidine cyclo-ligase, partial [Candidatus Paceibacterota bacterium]